MSRQCWKKTEPGNSDLGIYARANSGMTLEALSLPGGHTVKGETTREPHGVGAGRCVPREEPQECGASWEEERASARGWGPHIRRTSHFRPRNGEGSPQTLRPRLASVPGISDEVPTEARPTYLDRVSHHALPLLWSFPLPLLSPPSSLGESSEHTLNHQPAAPSSGGDPLCAHGGHFPA